MIKHPTDLKQFEGFINSSQKRKSAKTPKNQQLKKFENSASRPTEDSLAQTI